MFRLLPTLALTVALAVGPGWTPSSFLAVVAEASSADGSSGQGTTGDNVASDVQSSPDSQGKSPIDPIRIVGDERGDFLVSAGLELSPAGFEGLVVYGEEVTAYAEATTEATASLSARYVIAQGIALSLGFRTGFLHHREAWYGGPQTRSLKLKAPEIASVGVHYQTARSARGHSVGLALRRAAETVHVEASLSQIRDPLLLSGTLLYQADALSPDERSIGLGAGVSFVANERITLRGSTGLVIPLAGLQIPTSTISWRTAYLADVEGRHEIALYGSWTQNGQRSWTKVGLEWSSKLSQ